MKILLEEGSFQVGQPAQRLQTRQWAEDANSDVPPDEQLLLVKFSVASGTVSSSLASDPTFFSPTLTIYFTGIC